MFHYSRLCPSMNPYQSGGLVALVECRSDVSYRLNL